MSPRYIEPFPIIKRIGPVAYHLKLSPGLEKIHDVFHVSMLKKYMSDPLYILKTPSMQLRENLNFELQLVQILDQQDKVLRKKVILIVKVLWKSDRVEEITRELEASLRKQYPCCLVTQVSEFRGQNSSERGFKCDILFSIHFHAKFLGIVFFLEVEGHSCPLICVMAWWWFL